MHLTSFWFSFSKLHTEWPGRFRIWVGLTFILAVQRSALYCLREGRIDRAGRQVEHPFRSLPTPGPSAAGSPCTLPKRLIIREPKWDCWTLPNRLGNYKEMMVRYKQLLTYIKSAVTRNHSEKSINSILDYISTSKQMELLQGGNSTAWNAFRLCFCWFSADFLHDCQMAIVKFLDLRRLVLRAWGTRAPLH